MFATEYVATCRNSGGITLNSISDLEGQEYCFLEGKSQFERPVMASKK